MTDAMEKLKSRAAGWMVILTSFLFILVVQVYTASLTSMLTQEKMKVPSFENEKELIKNSNLHVGYQDGSWVRGLLIEQIGFKPEQLRPLGHREEYNKALSSGTIAAIFDETPYLTIFLSKYKSQFMMTGPLYKIGGFAFAFPKKSSLVSYFSDAILKVIQDVESYRVLMAKSSLPTSIEDLEFDDQSDIETSVIKRYLNPSSMIRWLRNKKQHFKLAKA
ncbi:glutamate receptor 2.8-like [Neltuma alba]|uniref:glutamate receptor 2.8-like n=1 Tax=Neltuma alba TaxID=207710 RepID=UPI0010A4F9AF|nr:glutamate receptor 2.8-like [Prosopis alba]